jgi:hypothetical protein
MLGEKTGEISGKITMQRVLPSLSAYPKAATSTGHGGWLKEQRRHRDLSPRGLFPHHAGTEVTPNDVAALFEYAIDRARNTHSEYWE